MTPRRSAERKRPGRRAFLRSVAGCLSPLAVVKAAGSRIAEVETIALQDPGKYGMTVVRVRTSDDVEGIGQAESPSLVIDAVIRTRGGLADLLNGEDPMQVERLWQKMYNGTGLWGRRGVTIAAIGAVETALWDIAGKIVNKPVSELIWRSFATVKATAQIKERVRPYATVYKPGDTDEEIRARFGAAARAGFRGVKFEEMPNGFAHVSVKNDARLIRLVRETIGDDVDLMIDVQNVWNDVGRAVETCKAIEPYRIYFLEAPFPADNLAAYRRLAESVDIRIAAGDWGFTSRFDYIDLMERGGVDIVQPSTVRSGGISEIVRIAELAYQRGLPCITHSWNQMVGVAAAIHIAAVVPNMPYIEFPLAYPASPLVSDLLDPPPVVDREGWLEAPKRPGLGFTLNENVIRRYRVPPG